MTRQEVASTLTKHGYNAIVEKGVVIAEILVSGNDPEYKQFIKKSREVEKALKDIGYNASWGCRGVSGEKYAAMMETREEEREEVSAEEEYSDEATVDIKEIPEEYEQITLNFA